MDTKELKRIAEAATPGPWRATQNYVIAEETEDRLGFRLPTRNFNGNREDGRKFGAYIAAANPVVVRALIARIAELEAAAGAPDLRSAIPTWQERSDISRMPQGIVERSMIAEIADLRAALASAALVEPLTTEEIAQMWRDSGGTGIPAAHRFARAIEARIMGGAK